MDPEAHESQDNQGIKKGKKKHEKRDPVTTLCAALQKPIFQKLRVVYEQGEVADLFVQPKEKVRHLFKPELLPPGDPFQVLQRLPNMSTVVAKLGVLRCKEAVKAFRGPHGANVDVLRTNLRQELSVLLKGRGKLKFRFWLDVKTHESVISCWGQAGSVEGTLRARLPENDLRQVLQIIKKTVKFEIGQVLNKENGSIPKKCKKRPWQVTSTPKKKRCLSQKLKARGGVKRRG